MQNNRLLTFAQAILEATSQAMERDKNVYLIGLGVPDPKGIFGTSVGLAARFGKERIMDMPVSENGMTGIAIGSAILGMRPIMVHQRADFFFLALDQLINNASKWHYMFGGLMRVPLVIRLIIGRGWGQGLQHSQSLHAVLSHFPGLKVVMPSTPYDAKGLLISAVEDPNPVVFFEHRWLHFVEGHVPSQLYREPIGKAKVLKTGKDITLVALSHMVVESLRALTLLRKASFSVELIDLRSIKPLDLETILDSVNKTGRLVVADPDWQSFSSSSEILAAVSEKAFHSLKEPPIRIAYPDRLASTSWAISNFFYPTAEDIAATLYGLMGEREEEENLRRHIGELRMKSPMDVPNSAFKGPF